MGFFNEFLGASIGRWPNIMITQSFWFEDKENLCIPGSHSRSSHPTDREVYEWKAHTGLALDVNLNLCYFNKLSFLEQLT